jgi:hypothetical protein
MKNWMGAHERDYDNLGLLLQRFGALFLGIWIGAGLSHMYPSVYWLTGFGSVLGFTLLVLAC